MKTVETMVLGVAQVNTYLLWENDHVMIIDPGSNAPRLSDMILERNAIVDAILLTHGHFDHIAGVDKLVNQFHCPVYMNELDVCMLTDPKLNCSAYMGNNMITVKSKPNILQPGTHKIGAFTITFIDAPGHSEGCSMIQCENYLFSGDVLFAQSIGRTDLIGGSNSKMMNSLKQFKQMDPNLIVYPGHGPSTTLQQELLVNPYLQF